MKTQAMQCIALGAGLAQKAEALEDSIELKP